LWHGGANGWAALAIDTRAASRERPGTPRLKTHLEVASNRKARLRGLGRTLRLWGWEACAGRLGGVRRRLEVRPWARPSEDTTVESSAVPFWRVHSLW
jgi:hypothetical protein